MSTAEQAHAHDDPSILKLTLTLAAVTTVAALVLGIVAYFTMPIAIENDVKHQDEAKRQVLPAATSFSPLAGMDHSFVGKDASGQTVGYVLATGEKGYGGEIHILLGVDTQGKITDYQIVAHNETPGLGEIAKKDKFRAQYNGRTVNQLEITKRGEQGKVQAITGATITTRAVTLAIQKAMKNLAAIQGNSAAQSAQTAPAEHQ